MYYALTEIMAHLFIYIFQSHAQQKQTERYSVGEHSPQGDRKRAGDYVRGVGDQIEMVQYIRGHAAGGRPLACTRPHERRPRECVRQSGTGRTGTLRGVRRHARDHHARVPAMPAIRSAQSPPDKGGR
jgi:hypothetical protein